MRLTVAVALLTFLLITPAFAAQHAAIPTLSAPQGDDGSVVLTLESLSVHVLLRGHLARTTYELTYRNRTDRQLDGDFAFPLPPDAEVSDLGLYFGDKLRHAVAVERVQARSVYEATVHRRVDPALAEWTASSRAFHFRVYPIPASGVKVVHIAYDQELTSNPYELDLRYGASLAKFEVSIESDSRIESEGLDLSRAGDRWSLRRSGFRLDGVIRAVPQKREVALVARSLADGNWYASAAVNIHSTARAVAPAPHVTILYDASSSAVQRDDARVLDYLRQLLDRQQGRAVSVVPFHIAVESAQETDSAGLEQTLASIPRAGATNLVALLEKVPAIAPGSRIVILTDGINSIGDSARLARAVQELAKTRRPLTIVNASPAADDHFLGGLARATGGWYLDLSQIDTASAVEASMRQPELLMLQPGFPPIRDLLPASVLMTNDATISVSARSRDAIVGFPIIAGNARHEIPVEVLESEEGIDLVRRGWARARLRSLLDSGATPEAVLEHGKQFNQLTPRTSLLVLETWQDYERNGLPIPPDLRAEKEAEERELRAQQEAERKRRSAIVLVSQAHRAPDVSPELARSVWYLTGSVVERDEPLPGVTVTMRLADGQSFVKITDAKGRFAFSTGAVPASVVLHAELAGFSELTRNIDHPERGLNIVMVMKPPTVSESITVTASAPELIVTAAVASNVTFGGSSNDDIAERLLDTRAGTTLVQSVLAQKTAPQRLAMIGEVVAKLKSLNSPADRFRYYLTSRSILGGEKVFQAESALAMREASPELALRVLTDLIEAYPDDAPTLRIIGRVLSAWGRDDLARLAFERALEISPRETQTWRELFLLDAREGKDKDLTELQTRYTAYERDARMQQTDDALQIEMQRRRSGTDPRIDPASELQVEAMWDSNYTDVDLHVIEPGGEEVFYNHPQSAKGGLLHADITTGFGPETYTIPHKASGPYQIVLHYYSGDDTRMTMETLVHVIIYVRGERQDYFIALTGKDDRRVVATVQ
jgi:tetratricopeptide (TPR) repeat protein